MFNQYKSIYVYGSGNWSRNVYNKIKKLYTETEVIIILQKHSRKEREALADKNTMEYQAIIPEKDAGIVVENGLFHKDEIEGKLQAKGFKDIIFYDHRIDDYINNSLDELPKLEIRFLAVCVGQACNLKCEKCANFAPYAHKDNLRYSVENIKRDLDKALSVFLRIDTFHIQGGEPFLYSDLGELLVYCKSKYGHIIKNIQIATNGTIIPSELLLSQMRETNAIVRISNYPIALKTKELADVLKARGIEYRIYNFSNKTGEWSDAGAIEYMISKETDVVKQVFECQWSTCFTIENGLIGRCARSIPALTLQNIKQRDLDYIDLKQESDINRFHKYFIFNSPMAACRHCKGTRGEAIKPAIQISV